MKIFCVALVMLFLLASCGDSSDSNPLGAPLFSVEDESTWGFALMAAMPEQEIYLYQREDVAMLYMGGQVLYFDDWANLFGGAARGAFPQMLYHDLDGDGRNELAISVVSGSGTGVALNNLYVLSFDEDGNHRLHYLLGWNVNDWFDIGLDFEIIEGESAFKFHFAGEDFIVNIFDDEYSTPLMGIGVGDIVSFWFDDSDIVVYVAVGKQYEGWTPVFFGGLQGKVLFDGEEFELKWKSFNLYTGGVE
jgi:hypothetical protein